VERAHATELIEDLLERVDAAAPPLDCVDELWLFGSYVRGALEPGDVDIDVEYTADEDLRSDEHDRMMSGRDWLAPIRRAVTARRRGFQASFQKRELYERKGIPLMLLWQRGDARDTALARLRGITPAPDAGRAPRDAMLPAFEGIDKWVPLPIRERLAPEVEASTLAIDRLVLADATPRDRKAARYATRRWQEGPLRRAGLAALAYVEQNGGNPRAVHLHGYDVDLDHPDTPYFVGFKWRFYRAIPWSFTEHGCVEWIELVNPTRTKPLHALRIVPLDRTRLSGVEF
jgi:hypothetical protein